MEKCFLVVFLGGEEGEFFKENKKRKVLLTFRCCICSQTMCISLEPAELSCLIKARTVFDLCREPCSRLIANTGQLFNSQAVISHCLSFI